MIAWLINWIVICIKRFDYRLIKKISSIIMSNNDNSSLKLSLLSCLIAIICLLFTFPRGQPCFFCCRLIGVFNSRVLIIQDNQFLNIQLLSINRPFQKTQHLSYYNSQVSHVIDPLLMLLYHRSFSFFDAFTHHSCKCCFQSQTSKFYST